jgi:small neutral amino acid transporter SnatA (MarC family)
MQLVDPTPAPPAAGTIDSVAALHEAFSNANFGDKVQAIAVLALVVAAAWFVLFLGWKLFVKFLGPNSY